MLRLGQQTAERQRFSKTDAESALVVEKVQGEDHLLLGIQRAGVIVHVKAFFLAGAVEGRTDLAAARDAISALDTAYHCGIEGNHVLDFSGLNEEQELAMDIALGERAAQQPENAGNYKVSVRGDTGFLNISKIQSAKTSPPIFAIWLLDTFLNKKTRNEQIGDLTEEYQQRVEERGDKYARTWLWGQVIRSFWPSIKQGASDSAAWLLRDVVGEWFRRLGS